MRPIRRVLIVHPYGIGDLLFTTPLLRALRLIPGIQRVDLLLGSRTKPMIETNPHINEIFVIDKDLFHQRSSRQNLNEVMNLGKELRKNRYDLLIDFSLRREYAFWSMLALGIPLRAGLDYKGRGFFHNYKLAIPDGFSTKHVVEYYCDLAEKVGVSVESRFMEFYVSDEARVRAGQIMAQHGSAYVIVAPGGGESWGRDAHLKRWPVDCLAQFLNQAGFPSSEKILIVGSPAEKQLCGELAALVQGPVADLSGELDLMVVAALLEEAALFVGNDGGLLHIAHALRRPTVGVFGPTDPNVYGPFPKSESSLVVTADIKPNYFKFRYNAQDDSILKIKPEKVLQKFKDKDFLKKIFQLSAGCK